MGDGGEPNGKCVPEIGCLVNGLFLDGGAWCHANNHLVEPKNGSLFNAMATVSGAVFVDVDIATATATPVATVTAAAAAVAAAAAPAVDWIAIF